ncbi:MAG: ABC transporter permease [Proteobacteria bacterium]|nr:ABC transporter permease [Pseudomonadota bacterium]
MSRFNYVLIRLLQIVPTFLCIMVVIFVLVRLLPGDPTSAILGDKATDEAVQRINAELGLDRSIFYQFVVFLERVASGDLGSSIVLKVPVRQLIQQRLPVTLMLTLYAALLAVLVAVPIAFLAALKRNRPTDNAIRAIFQVGLSMPVFYVGLILLSTLAANFRWFPVGGYGETALQHLYHLFLPALTLAFSFAAILMRNLRAAIIEVLHAEYVDFARSKGLRQSVVMGQHVLRNALVSSITLFGLHIGSLVGGAVVTETVFAIPGAGRLMVDSIFGRDYPVVQGLTMTLAVMVSLVFLATDLLQAWLDPRVGK